VRSRRGNGARRRRWTAPARGGGRRSLSRPPGSTRTLSPGASRRASTLPYPWSSSRPTAAGLLTKAVHVHALPAVEDIHEPRDLDEVTADVLGCGEERMAPDTDLQAGMQRNDDYLAGRVTGERDAPGTARLALGQVKGTRRRAGPATSQGTPATQPSRGKNLTPA
jgi:hypothetical protein